MNGYALELRSRLARCLVAAILPVMLVACNDLLSVEDPVNLTPDDLEGAAPVALTINGVRGSFQAMYDYYVLHTGILADEFILAGTFPYRQEMDERAVTLNNDGLLNDLYAPLSTARFLADTAVAMLEGAQGEPGVDPAALRDGIALAQYFGGYTRLLLAEGFCSSAVSAGPSLSSDERMADALATFEAAEALAATAGRSDLVAAAQVGQARAQLWLRDFAAAVSTAGEVPRNFAFRAYYSTSSIPQKNKVARYTWAIDEVIRWTVGDGSLEFAAHEEWPYFDEWVRLGLLEPRPDLQSFNLSVPVNLQQKYTTGDAAIVMASSVEAKLIRAEGLLRTQKPAEAESIVNDLRQDHWSLGPISFTGDLIEDLKIMARERARELWLTGGRLATLRRYLIDGLDLFPSGKLGADTCFPVPQQERDTNPNL